MKQTALWMGVMFCLGVGLAAWSEFYFVFTPSIPPGVYRATHEKIERGSYVVVCLPEPRAVYGRERGYLSFGLCSGWTQAVVKVVGAVEGDEVDIEESGVKVNGEPLPNSRTLLRDSQNRELFHVTWGKRFVDKEAVWLFALHDKRSWDSRYFDYIHTKYILYTARPVWVAQQTNGGGGSTAVTKIEEGQ